VYFEGCIRTGVRIVLEITSECGALSGLFRAFRTLCGVGTRSIYCSQTHQQFDPKKSTTYQGLGRHNALYYGTGAVAQATGIDRVKLGDLELPWQPLGFTIRETDFPFLTSPMDGILGLLTFSCRGIQLSFGASARLHAICEHVISHRHLRSRYSHEPRRQEVRPGPAVAG